MVRSFRNGLESTLYIFILAAREDVYGVCVGGILGHALCTGLAVIGGKIIATRISVRTVTLVSVLVLYLNSSRLKYEKPQNDTGHQDFIYLININAKQTVRLQIGGVVFLLFAVSALVIDPES